MIISVPIGQFFSIMVLPKMKWNGEPAATKIKRSKFWAIHDHDRGSEGQDVSWKIIVKNYREMAKDRE